MSYADAAARGPPQSAEESSRAPIPPQIIQQDLEPQTTVDVDSPHVTSVHSDFSGETDTQYERIEREMAQAEREARARFEQAEKTATHEYSKAKKTIRKVTREAEESVEDAGARLRENSDNPVVIGNFVIWSAVAAAIGFGAYRQHQAGNLNWKVAGTWAGVIGIFAAGDYYFSQLLFKKKYPRK